MKKHNLGKSLTAFALIWMMLVAMPLAGAAQTRIKMPRNKYKVEDDVKIGREASVEVEKQFPILNDTESTRYIETVGRRLVAAIPEEFQEPAFRYTFKIVNARDINAFALPGGPMYVNRGMIEAAKNEGEMAGVMAHEISHVALRHGTAQATQQSNPLNQILGAGATLGGLILGGQTGAAIGQSIYAGLLVYPYSREYETQADTLGAQILARAGYDPRDLANMFKTIEKESGGNRTPEWLSTHPNPGNRYENINREADLLRVSPNPIKITREFERTQAKLRALPRAKTMEEIEKENKRGGGGGGQTQGESPTSGGRYETNVEYPSTRTRIFSNGNWIQMRVPDNWQDFVSDSTVEFAPTGAYGNQGITRGALIGIFRGGNSDLNQDSQEYVESILKDNNYLRRQGGSSRTTLNGRSALSTLLTGRSPVTGRTENATVYTTMLRNGDLFYIVTVVPGDEASRYSAAFRNMLNSIRLYD